MEEKVKSKACAMAGYGGLVESLKWWASTGAQSRAGGRRRRIERIEGGKFVNMSSIRASFGNFDKFYLEKNIFFLIIAE